MTVAIYARISRDEQGEGLGVRRQEQDCRTLVTKRGLKVGRVFTDNDISAYSGRRRPAYEDMVAAIRAGTVKTVVAWAPERLHRSPRELEDFIELIDEYGVNVETVKAGTWDVSTSHGRLIARMFGAVSRAESERMGERISRAHQQAKADGRWRGPIPYGLQIGSQPGMPEIDPGQAPIVRELFTRILRGDALTRIAADLNAQGIRPRRGVLWTHTGARRLIGSPALGGLVEIDGELRPAAFEGVVDATTWRSAQSALRSRPRGELRRPREKLTLLGGILTCAQHGYVCIGGGATHGLVYVAAGAGRCNVSIKRDAADALITAVVLGRLRQPDARQLFVAPENPDNEKERQELLQRRTDIAGLLADGMLGASEARTQLEALSARLHALPLQRSGSLVEESLFADPEGVWADLTQPQRRSVLRVLFSDITLRHVGPRGGPKADATRIKIQWTSC